MGALRHDERPGAAHRSARTLADAWSKSKLSGNNFDAIRLFAAVLVLVAHSFLIADGRNADILSRFSGGQSDLGNLGIGIFFVLSGFLIAKSWKREPDIAVFARNRFLRIYPAMAVVILAAVFIIGPAMTSLPLADYATHEETWRYFAHLGFLYNFGSLPGVFDGAPYKPTVNGSLWTLQIEALCYASLPLLHAFRGLTLRGCLIVQIVCMAIAVLVGGTIDSPAENFLRQIGVMVSWFYGGALLAITDARVRLDWRLAALAAACLAWTCLAGGFAQAFSFAGAYLVLYLAFAPMSFVRDAGRFGDFSYGLYLWGWPVQQFVQSAVAPGNAQLNLAIALPVTLFIAALSWRFIEAPMLALKRRPAAALAASPAH